MSALEPLILMHLSPANFCFVSGYVSIFVVRSEMKMLFSVEMLKSNVVFVVSRCLHSECFDHFFTRLIAAIVSICKKLQIISNLRPYSNFGTNNKHFQLCCLFTVPLNFKRQLKRINYNISNSRAE